MLHKGKLFTLNVLPESVRNDKGDTLGRWVGGTGWLTIVTIGCATVAVLLAQKEAS